MGTTLTGTTPASTYDSLIKVTDNDSLDATLKTLSDGLGNDSALALSTLGMKLNVSATLVTDPASISHYGINNYLYVRGGTAGLVMGDDALSNRIEFVDGGEIKFETNSIERLRIDSAGNVGIGTTSPSVALHTNGFIRSANAGNTVHTEVQNDGLYATGTDLYLVAPATKFLSLYSGGSEKMRITSAGNVGIGTSAPNYKLNVVTNEVAGRQNLSSIDRTSGNLITFTNPHYSVDASMGLLLRVFPQSDARQGAGIIASGGTSNGVTDLDLFVSSGATTSTSYSALKVKGDTGNVGIGTASPNMPLEVVGSTANLFGNVYATSRFLQDKTDYRGLFLGYDTSGQNAVIAAESAGGTSNLAFYTYNGSSWGERARVTSNGLTFNGDTASANALDDYEEGTFTPTFSGATITGGSIKGSYTKIGRQVYITIQFINATISGASGNAQINSLPFTCNADYYGVSNITYGNALSTDASGWIAVSSTTIYLMQGSSVTNASWVDGTNSQSIMVNAVYQV